MIHRIDGVLATFGITSATKEENSIMMSPLTTIIKRNSSSDPEGVEIVFGSTELEITLTPSTFWSALKNIGGIFSIMLFYAFFAGCTHIG